MITVLDSKIGMQAQFRRLCHLLRNDDVPLPYLRFNLRPWDLPSSWQDLRQLEGSPQFFWCAVIVMGRSLSFCPIKKGKGERGKG